MTCAVSSNGFLKEKKKAYAPTWVERRAFSFFGFLLVWDPVTADKAVTENGLTDDSTSNFLLIEDGASCMHNVTSAPVKSL